jgi:MFS family permease
MSRVLHKTGLVSPRIHIMLIVAVTFFALLVSAGLRATGVLMMPLQINFGWDRATISFAAAIGIFLYGLVGPFAAALMMSFGIRRTMLAGLMLMAISTFASLWMRLPAIHPKLGCDVRHWQRAVASVLGAAVVNRWFATRQGLVMGLLSASTATGALIFLPFLAWLSNQGAWRPVVLAVSLACLILVPIVALVLPEHPDDIGARRFGEAPDSAPAAPPKQARTAGLAISVLIRAGRQRVFWLLFGTFFVCGLTTNGLVGTHMIAFCGDHGIAPVAAAAVDDGLLRSFRHDRIGVAHRSLQSARATDRLLWTARALADGAALPELRHDEPGRLRDLLRARLDRNRSADREARQRSVRSRRPLSYSAGSRPGTSLVRHLRLSALV